MAVNKLTGMAKKEAGNRVKALMVQAGIKQVEIAAGEHVSTALVSGVVAGKKRSIRIRKAIAEALGMKVSDLWPNGKRAA